MSGHSKWTNIKHRKAAQDNKRGKVFTKIIRELVIAARLGGSDSASNPRLRSAIDRALSNNIPRYTLNRAISRGIGNDGNDNLETIIYEGYGPGGTAIIVECLSDNRNRTVSNIRYSFTKYGGNLGTNGSVSYLFVKCGVISYKDIYEDKLIDGALNANAEDVKSYDNGLVDVYTKFETFSSILQKLDLLGFHAISTKLTMIPLIKINLNTNIVDNFLRLIDTLENFDDVQYVYHNGNI
ncbi:putative transcriptional regulatory protein YebC [Candidatus Arsenophonus lipoptenae]|uniref:Probable transcriptional regulatory protein AUT07_00655 n=1 Tax=Candidatus Arsenophonus lipoptenae TaxID=634113 RepID=A0A120HPY8_9GAMM|nr:YebC/PmpR family DNA-binding transcriptional regulator [Candidatus Arsenophonus lipoptenae]AMA65203.1 putative transcriptional regulatory protein YebC [Candidatus Arsenophonus lipoptenae]